VVRPYNSVAMERSFAPATRWLFAPESGPTDRALPRWIFLRGLGLIYFSAFYSLLFQIKGLIGPDGILPASEYLEGLAKLGLKRFWYAPTLLWFASGPHMLMATCWIGIVAAILLVVNVWPRVMLVVCFVCFLSFVSAAQDFSSYQSDGMLLEAGFISVFMAPPGLRPGLGQGRPPMRASLFLLQWEWFRIYFESGLVKLASGETQWRNFTAMDEYYQNGPLPTWIGWYVQQLPHGFHAFATGATLALELGLVWTLFLPRRWRIACFFVVTLWQIPVILTANYTFLNYLVLLLGVLLLDDRFLKRWLPQWMVRRLPLKFERSTADAAEAVPIQSEVKPRLAPETGQGFRERLAEETAPIGWARGRVVRYAKAVGIVLSGVVLSWIFYATTVEMVWILVPEAPLPTLPVVALEPFRIANRYGLFAVMTRGRYEIEFQGSIDGQTWVPYEFRYKPQDMSLAPRIYAPYQPRFEWNLWFASLDTWRDNMFVVSAEERLLANNPDVLALFRANPFADSSPRLIRAVVYQYWFTSLAEKRASGMWWRRKFLGLYAPVLTYGPDGKLEAVEWPPPPTPRR
jgi:lipase maturation factor